MEVHQHTHTERKKWHHYFWEFFMLFLAVTLGFFVENQRENFVEGKRERQYIRSMIADLKEDTVKYTTTIIAVEKKVSGLDSMLDALNKPPLNATFLYYYMRKYVSGYNWVETSQRTLSQLKNAGGMRLIHYQDASDSINDYDLSLNWIRIQESAIQNYFEIARQEGWEIFDWYSIKSLKTSAETAEKILQSGLHLQLLTTDSKILKKYSNAINVFRGVNNFYIGLLIDRRAKAERLILFLQKKYSLQ
jgi:hypothetical protein